MGGNKPPPFSFLLLPLLIVFIVRIVVFLIDDQIKSFDSVQVTLCDNVGHYPRKFAQEVNRLKSLPDTVRNFYYEKGLLYIGIKGINDWGRAFHRGDAAAANAYNLSILYRYVGKRRPKADASEKK